MRTQAVALTTDLADRIRANRGGLASYATASYGADGPEIQDACLGGDCTPDVLAQDDLGRWKSMITLLMPGGTTSTVTYTDVAAPDPDQYTITIAWRESGDTADSTCTMVVEL